MYKVQTDDSVGGVGGYTRVFALGGEATGAAVAAVTGLEEDFFFFAEPRLAGVVMDAAIAFAASTLAQRRTLPREMRLAMEAALLRVRLAGVSRSPFGGEVDLPLVMVGGERRIGTSERVSTGRRWNEREMECWLKLVSG